MNLALSSLHGESLKITLAVPLRELCKRYCEIVLTTSHIRTQTNILLKSLCFESKEKMSSP